MSSEILRRGILLVAYLAVAVTLAACRSATPEPAISPIASPTMRAVTAVPSETAATPAIDPGQPQKVPDTPEPSPGLGVVHGRLIDESGRPVRQFPVFLASLWPLETEDGTASALLVDTVQAPRAVTDDEGSFAFSDVEPDTYGFHYGYPGDVGAGFLRDPRSRDALLFDVRADVILDVGDVVRRSPSGSGG